jgi:hypothetical protein
VYVGERYPGDILAGYALRILAGVFVVAFMRSRYASALEARLPAALRSRFALCAERRRAKATAERDP